jgi:DNA-binding NarL/FixJ family response regulator
MGSLQAQCGVRHEVLVPLPPQGVLDRRLLLFRSGGIDFTDHEVLLLRMLRPHIAELHQRRQRELSRQFELTPRQWEILRRVASGASNAQVARVLGLSQATVRKHLENVFVRLQVASRTEAVDRVRSFLDVA